MSASFSNAPAVADLQMHFTTLAAQLAAQQDQIGDLMTSLKNQVVVIPDPVETTVITGPATTAGTPLPVPPANKNVETYKRLLTANLTDYAYASAAPGRNVSQAFTNAAGSGAFIWTINAQSGDVFNAPDLVAATSFSLANGETRTFVNSAPGVWDQV